MSRRRDYLKTVEPLDIELINTKIHNLARLTGHVDYDHYRAGINIHPAVQQSMNVRLNGLCNDISPCDFAAFLLALLRRYTAERVGAECVVPQYYFSSENEIRAFEKFVEYAVPRSVAGMRARLRRGEEVVQFQSFFYFNYERLFDNRNIIEVPAHSFPRLLRSFAGAVERGPVER